MAKNEYQLLLTVKTKAACHQQDPKHVALAVLAKLDGLVPASELRSMTCIPVVKAKQPGDLNQFFREQGLNTV